MVHHALERERQGVGTAARGVLGFAALVALLSGGSALASGQGLPVVLLVAFAIFLFWAIFAGVVHAVRTGAPVTEHPLVVALEGPAGALTGVRDVTVPSRRGDTRVVVVELANRQTLALVDPEEHDALFRALTLALSGAPPDVAAAERAFAPRRRRRRRLVASALLVASPLALAAVQYQLATAEHRACDAVRRRIELRASELQDRDMLAVTASDAWPTPEPVTSLEACGVIEDALVYERYPEPDFENRRRNAGPGSFPERGPSFPSCSFELLSFGRSRSRARCERELAEIEAPRPFVDVAESTHRFGDESVTQEFVVRVLDLEAERVTCEAHFVLEAPDSGRLFSVRERTVDAWIESARGG